MCTKRLTILQINDIHGYLEPHWEMVRERGEWEFKKLGGLAKIAGLFQTIRDEEQGSVIALDNGDTFHGTYEAVSSKGLALVPIFNALELDAMTVHWEFAFTPEGVRDLESKLNYPVLAVNCFNKSDKSLFFKPYKMFDRNGLKVAVIGLACPIVDKTMPPSFSKGVRFEVGNKELPKWIECVRQNEKADVVIVLSHLGFPQDIQLAKDVSGIDVIVSGHTHNRMDHAVVENGAIVFQSGCHGSFVGRLDLEIQEGKIISHKHHLIPIDESIHEKSSVTDLVQVVTQPHKAMLAAVVGATSQALHRYSMLSSPMDDVLLEAIAEAAGTDISFSNGWRYGVPIPIGPVTMQDLWNIIPTNPKVQTVEMLGSEIRQMLEENLERTFAANPYEQMGGYVKRMRGLKLYFKSENAKGYRVDRLFAGHELINSDKRYKVAFVTTQGVPEKFGINRTKLDMDAVTALKTFFASKSVVAPSPLQTVFQI